MTNALLGIIYLAFVSLGLPDGLLGAAWPAMHVTVGANVSLAGVVSMVICLGTITSSLLTVELVRGLGTGRLTAVSVALTAVALFGFSASSAFGSSCSGRSRTGWGQGRLTLRSTPMWQRTLRHAI